jgi:hypothetical protein
VLCDLLEAINNANMQRVRPQKIVIVSNFTKVCLVFLLKISCFYEFSF